MRILIISTFFPPLNSIASLRPYSWAKYWTKLGHDVTVLTMEKPPSPLTDLHLPNAGYRVIEAAPPRFIQALKKGYQGEKNSSKAASGPISWLKSKGMKLYHYLRFERGILNACRMPDFADFWIRSADRAIKKEGSWDLVVSTAGPYAVHILGERLKRRGATKRWIADYRDNWSSNHIYPGLFPFTIIEKMLEKKLMRSADAITATSAPFAAKMQADYGGKPVSVIENGFDPDDFARLPKESIFPADGKFRIVYTGTIYPGRQDASPFLQALGELARDPTMQPFLAKLEVLFVGHQLDHLRHLVQQHGVEPYIHILGFVSREQALRMQRDAHLLLFIVWKNLSERGVFSGKIFEYLFSGTPIMAIGAEGEEESQALIKESGCGMGLPHIPAIKQYLMEALARGTKEAHRSDPKVLERFKRENLALKLLELVS